jgi:hypothetical protein
MSIILHNHTLHTQAVIVYGDDGSGNPDTGNVLFDEAVPQLGTINLSVSAEATVHVGYKTASGVVYGVAPLTANSSSLDRWRIVQNPPYLSDL